MSELQKPILISQANRLRRTHSALTVVLCGALTAALASPGLASVPQKDGVTHSSSTLHTGGTGHDSVVSYGFVPPPRHVVGMPISNLAGTREGRAAIALHRATIAHNPAPAATPEPVSPLTPLSGGSVSVVRTSLKVTSSPGTAPSLVSELRKTTSSESPSRSLILPGILLAGAGLLVFGWRRYSRSLDAELRGYGIDPGR